MCLSITILSTGKYISVSNYWFANEPRLHWSVPLTHCREYIIAKKKKKEI